MSNHSWKIDGEKEISNKQASVVWENDRFFTINFKNQQFHGEVMEEQLENRSLKIKVNHREFLISKEGPLDKLIEELGLNKVKVRKLKQLKSPMPGRIVSVAVTIGQEVELGSELLTLEAMKMENVLKSDGVGIVKSIDINPSDVVDKGAVLITFE
jgi:acetyl/propionyl-CoA carboxylase alpha subunit